MSEGGIRHPPSIIYQPQFGDICQAVPYTGPTGRDIIKKISNFLIRSKIPFYSFHTGPRENVLSQKNVSRKSRDAVALKSTGAHKRQFNLFCVLVD